MRRKQQNEIFDSSGPPIIMLPALMKIDSKPDIAKKRESIVSSH